MKSAVVYARLSDVRKGESEGIERQVREAEAHAGRVGVEVVERLVDNDLSAAKSKRRPAFERLMEGIAANEWDVVVLRSLDRWVRRPAELERIIEVVEKSRVKVEAIHGDIDLRTRSGRLNARLVTAVAMSEVEATRERVTDWHRDRAERGLPMAGNAGYGFMADKVTIDKDEAKRIREAAKRVLSGEALLSITRRWNDQGVTMRGREWKPTALRRVLLAPRTAGLRPFGDVLVDAAWAAILDRETWERVGRVLNSPSRLAPGTRAQKVLTGLLTCGVGLPGSKVDGKRDKRPACGKPLNHKTTGKGGRYYCRHCLGTLIAADQIEAFVKGAVLEAVDLPDLRAAVKRMRKGAAASDVMEQIASIEADLSALATELGEGRLTMTEFKAARAGMDRRLAVLRQEVNREATVEPLARWVGRGALLADQWDGLAHQDKRAIIAAVFPEIVVLPAVKGHNRFNRDRVQLTPAGAAAVAAA